MRRVVVTGLGAVTPLGVDVRSTWDAVLAGTSGVGPITRFDAKDFSTTIAAEVKGFDPERFIDRKEIKRMDPFIHYAMAAAHMAMEDAGLVIDAALGPKVGVYMGSGLGGLSTLERYHQAYMEGGPRKISPFFITMLISNLAPGHIAMRYGAKGPNVAMSTACSASSHATGEGMHAVRSGVCDVVGRCSYATGLNPSRRAVRTRSPKNGSFE
jgi:3-oxoacyl-[acyl-carrier-protein] synthase II